MSGTLHTDPTISVGRNVHVYVHRGLEKYGPIHAVVVDVTRYGQMELRLFPGTEHAWLVNDFEVVSNKPGPDPDPIDRNPVTWEWPTKP